MSKQIRVSLSDEAYEALTAEVKKRDTTQGELLSAAVLWMLRPQEESLDGIAVLGGQIRFLQLMVGRLLEEAGIPLESLEALLDTEAPATLQLPSAQDTAMKQADTPRVATEEETWPDLATMTQNAARQHAQHYEEPVPEDFRQPQKRSLLTRFFYKEE